MTTLYKTKFCTHISNCRYGQNCTHAHNRAELRPLPGYEIKFRTQLCYDFPNCPRGERCSFAHSNRELRPPQNVPFKLWRTELCNRGNSCQFGTKCWFAHSAADLRTPEENIAYEEYIRMGYFEHTSTESTTTPHFSVASPLFSVDSPVFTQNQSNEHTESAELIETITEDEVNKQTEITSGYGVNESIEFIKEDASNYESIEFHNDDVIYYDSVESTDEDDDYYESTESIIDEDDDVTFPYPPDNLKFECVTREDMAFAVIYYLAIFLEAFNESDSVSCKLGVLFRAFMISHPYYLDTQALLHKMHQHKKQLNLLVNLFRYHAEPKMMCFADQAINTLNLFEKYYIDHVSLTESVRITTTGPIGSTEQIYQSFFNQCIVGDKY